MSVSGSLNAFCSLYCTGGYRKEEHIKKCYKAVAKEIRVRRTEYNSWNRKVKELVKDSKRKVDEFSIKPSDKFNKNK